MTDYLSQSEKHELQALLACGSFEEREYLEDDEDDDGEKWKFPLDDSQEVKRERGTLSPAEYARNLCAFDRNDAIRNGLCPSHVSSARRSMPVGWTW